MNNIDKVVSNMLGNVGADIQAEKVYKTNKKLKEAPVSDLAQTKDKVMFSEEGLKAAQNYQDVARLSETAKNMPDIDEQKLREIAAKVERGEYFTPEAADKTAQKILQSIDET